MAKNIYATKYQVQEILNRIFDDTTNSILDGPDILYAFANVAASQTDSSLIAAVTGKKIVVHQLLALAGGTATTLTLNTKGAGAGTAISPLLANGANGGEVLPYSKVGWLKTTTSEALTATTGAGSATGILIGYSLE